MKLKLLIRLALGAMALLASTAAYAEPYKIAVSNSYIGNEWRVQMIKFMEAYTAKNLKGKVELTVNNSGTDAQKQIAVLSDMISAGVNAILVNPASDTALDAVIEEACKQNILVIAFDQPVTAPCAYVVAVDFTEIGRIHAQWLADTLGGKGNVVINRGVSGFPADTNMNAGMTEVLAKYPDIKVVGEVYGKWDNAVSQQELTKVLTANPKVDGILNQYGTYGALQALLNLNRPLVAMSGQGENGWRIAMLDYKDKGLQGVSAGDPAVIGAYALKIAVDILDGKAPADKHVAVLVPTVTTAELKPGTNVFPDLSPTLDADTDIPGANLGLTIEDGTGK
ncbi:MAG: substrate-binding domain-containing protein [Mesorhizobium sp.]|nr:substrate-binding domain-containing protein [Mesorhizobium sp.]MBL8576534.1 substrate-binding domain-containing protein [Mesorhizobium sp.]